MQLITEAKLWTENLGEGKPYDADTDVRLENWLNYQCYSSLGDAKKALESVQKIIAFTPKLDNTVMNFLAANQVVSAWAIEKTSSKEKATAWLKKQA